MLYRFVNYVSPVTVTFQCYCRNLICKHFFLKRLPSMGISCATIFVVGLIKVVFRVRFGLNCTLAIQANFSNFPTKHFIPAVIVTASFQNHFMFYIHCVSWGETCCNFLYGGHVQHFSCQSSTRGFASSLSCTIIFFQLRFR